MYGRQVNKDRKGLTAKLTGPRSLILEVLDTLERHYIITEVSRFKPNRDGDGFHVFVTLAGVTK